MRIAVVGAGGVGGYFGGRLAQAGEQVVFIARGAHGAAIASRGLQIFSPLGDALVTGVEVSADPATVGVVDAVLVAVKAWQVAEVAPVLRPLIGTETAVVPLQNGVEAPDQLAAALGTDAVLGGLCRIIAFIDGPGQIRHVGIAPYVAFGELDNRTSERAARLQAALMRAGVQAEIPAQIGAAIWEKFLFITPTSGVGAITRAPLGVTRSLPQTRRLVEAGMREVEALARARGIPLRASIVADTMAFYDGLPAAGTSSLQRDIAEGKPSELEAQSGAVVRLGGAAGVPTPVHDFIYAGLLPQELEVRGGLPTGDTR